MQLELFDNSVYVQSSTLYVRRLLALNHTRKAFLIAAGTKITYPTILRQIRPG